METAPGAEAPGGRGRGWFTLISSLHNLASRVFKRGTMTFSNRFMQQVRARLDPAVVETLPAQAQALLLSDTHVINGVIAACLVLGAHDIPDPRQTHRGPWTPDWTPL